MKRHHPMRLLRRRWIPLDVVPAPRPRDRSVVRRTLLRRRICGTCSVPRDGRPASLSYSSCSKAHFGLMVDPFRVNAGGINVPAQRSVLRTSRSAQCVSLRLFVFRIASPPPSAPPLAGVVRAVPSLWSGRRRRPLVELGQHLSRFAAQQGDVALVVDAGQVHPHAQLTRPDLTGGVVGPAADGQQRAVPAGKLSNQRAKRALLGRRCRLQIDQCQLDAMPHRLPKRVFGTPAHDRRPELFVSSAH
jgi:hypothetical protein